MTVKATMAKISSSIFGELLRRQRRWLKLLGAAVAASAVSLVMFAGALRSLVDDGIVNQTAPLDGLLRNVVVTALLFGVVQFAYTQVIARLSWHVEFELRVWLFTRLQSADVRRLDALTSGQIISRALTDVTLVEHAMRALPLAAAGLPALLGLAIFLLIQNVLIGLAAAAALPVNLWLLSVFRHRLRALSWAEINERAEAAAAIDEPVRGIRVVHAFDRAPDERARVAAVALRVYRFAMARVRLLAKYDIFLKAVPVLVNAFLLWLGITMAADGDLSLGTMLLAFQLVAFVTQFAQTLDDYASSWQYMIAAQSRLSDLLLLGRPPTTVGQPLPDDDDDADGMALLGVSVRLGGRQVLDAFELVVSPGELVVLRGAPGSGKTTVASLATGLLAPDDGRVTIAGVDVHRLDAPTARGAVLVAAEVPFVFAGTIRENLELALAEPATDEELHRALHLAGAEDVVAALPGGLDAEIGDRGLTLSGGQRQRVALARALVRPPRVLVLDDALSAVNPAREVEILDRIRAACPRTAILCVTRRHGPTTIADRDLDLPEPSTTAPEVPVAPTAPPAGGLDERHLEILRRLHEEQHDDEPTVPAGEADADRPLSARLLLRPYAGLIAAALVLLVLITVTRLAPSILIGNAADLVRDDDAVDRIGTRALALAAAGVVLGFGSWAFRIVSQRYAQSVIYLLRRRVFHRLSRLGIDFYDREVPGKVAARVVYDLDNLLEFLQRPGFAFVTIAAQVLLGLVAILVVSPSAFVIVAIGVAFTVAVSLYFIPRSMRALEWMREALGEVTARFEEDFSGRRDIRIFGAAEKRTTELAARAWELRRATRRSLTLANVYGAVLRTAGDLLGAVVLFQAGRMVLDFELSVGSALTLQLLAVNATAPLAAIGGVFIAFQRTQVSWRRLNEPFGVPILPVDAPDPAPCPALSGQVRLEHVAFGYPHTGQRVLHDIDIELHPGSTVALVGYTGAGKSSITKLLLRTYDPDDGRVLVDGIDVRDLRVADYRRQVGVVPQDPFLFKGTVATNIAYGRPDATRAEIEAAAREVGALDILAGLPGGLDHEVHEEGRNLTGAQQQLVALARAWMAKPAFMILDEATSALDAATERSTLEAVTRLECTTLMVTHRESVVAVADHIVVLDGGRIVEAGAPDTVIGAGGAYDRLWVAEPAVQEPV